MENVSDCPCSAINEHHPYEGFMTRHKCMLKKKMTGVCDKETIEGCRLFDRMQLDEELRKFIKGWVGE